MKPIHIRKRDWSSRFTFIFVLALCASAFYLMIMLLPAWLGHRQMREATADIVRRGALQRLDLADLRAQLVEKARESRLPAEARIDLNRDGRFVSAHISYTRTLHLPFYSWDWPLEIHVVDTGL
jgi:hypothetical protein